MKCGVSVIVPIFNSRNYLERCIRSLMTQTLTEDIEYLFVNDGSTDDSMSILYKVLLNYPNRKSQIRIIDNKDNKGISIVRKIAIHKAKNEYIGFVDSDDWIENGMYEEMLKSTSDGKIDIVVADYWLEDTNRVEIKHYKSHTPQNALADSWKEWHLPLGLPFQLIRRDLLLYASDNVIPTMQGEDTYMIRYVYSKAQTVVFLNKAFYHYDRMNTGSVTHNSVITREQWEAHKININKITEMMCHLDNAKIYSISINHLKLFRKFQYRSVFNSLHEFYYTYPESHKAINHYFHTHNGFRWKTYLVYNFYPLFYIWNRIHM